mmetsp:Transcript_37977/g.80418  ORF Transcript_37977/g.80418 Transcript_37977/m.80418 type:complete len:339 (+) Transcript_37977:82-1098(+)
MLARLRIPSVRLLPAARLTIGVWLPCLTATFASSAPTQHCPSGPLNAKSTVRHSSCSSAPNAMAANAAATDMGSPSKKARNMEPGTGLRPTSVGSDESAHGPFDCHGNGSVVTGRRCHSECEARHLDEAESKRFEDGTGFMYPEKPRIIIAASRDMSRTASTWAYNAIRLLYRQAKVACDSYWIRTLTKEKLEKRLETGANVLIKTHEWTDMTRPEKFEKITPLFSNVVVSVRNGFDPDPDWIKYATYQIHFEDIVAKTPADGLTAVGVLKELAEHLGIEGLTEYDYKIVDYDLNTLPIPAYGVDQTTKHWFFHARRGGRATPEKPEEPQAAGPDVEV